MTLMFVSRSLVTARSHNLLADSCVCQGKPNGRRGSIYIDREGGVDTGVCVSLSKRGDPLPLKRDAAMLTGRQQKPAINPFKSGSWQLRHLDYAVLKTRRASV